MAINIYDKWYSVIINVDSIIRIYGENGLEVFLEEFLPNPYKKEKKKRVKFSSLFSKKRSIQGNIKGEYTVDDYSFIQRAQKFNYVTSFYGHDGNLVYMSFANEEDMSACLERLESGLYGHRSIINEDYIICDKDCSPINVSWLEIIEEVNAPEYSSPHHVFSISPFKQPIRPMSFPCNQGGVGYSTGLQWNLAQKYIRDKEYNKFIELTDISLIYTNCNIGYHITESVDEWFRAYDTKIDLSKLSGNMEYKLLTILGDCIHACNFIPLYCFLDDSTIFRLGMSKAEKPVSKYDLTIKLTKTFQKTGDIYYSIQFQSEKNRYVGLIRGQGIRNIIYIEVRQNKIQTLWLVEEESYILPKDTYTILNQISKEWNQGNPLYIERYLSENFKYTLYGENEIFGDHVLSKRQYIIWWECACETYAKHGVTYQDYSTSENTNGIACFLNKSARFIQFEIVDGVIISAEERATPYEGYDLK